MTPPLRAPAARQTELLNQIVRAGFMSVGDLAAATGVSEITVRRDLAALEKEGAVRRTHGGALGLGHGEADVFDALEPSFAARRRRNAKAKSAIAKAAFTLVRPGQSLAIDTGTTTYEFARECAAMADLSIVTNNARIAGVLAETSNAVYLPAGRLRGGELSIFGSMAVETVMTFNFETCFLGASGISAEGVFDYSTEDAALKRAFMARSSKVVVLCDASKFNHRALVSVGRIDQINTVVCDRMPPARLAQALQDAGVEIIPAEPV